MDPIVNIMHMKLFMFQYIELPCGKWPCLFCTDSADDPGLSSCHGILVPAHESLPRYWSSIAHGWRHSPVDVQPCPPEGFGRHPSELYTKSCSCFCIGHPIVNGGADYLILSLPLPGTYFFMVAPGRGVVVQTIVWVKVHETLCKGLVRIICTLNSVSWNEIVQSCFATTQKRFRHTLALPQVVCFALKKWH